MVLFNVEFMLHNPQCHKYRENSEIYPQEKAKRFTESDFIQKEQFYCSQHKLLSIVTKKSALPRFKFFHIFRTLCVQHTICILRLGISMHSEMYQNNLQLGSVQISWTLTKKYNLVHLLFLDKKKILICFSVPTEEELKF